MNNQIEWRRAFIRSSFNPRDIDGTFDFNGENRSIQEFLVSVLEQEEIGQADSYKGGIFSPPSVQIDELAWLAAFEKSRGGSEGGRSDMERFEIRIMDTYMAGIVRWVNAAGIETYFSCDGHGYQKAEMHLRRKSQERCLNYLLYFASDEKWRFQSRCFLKGDERSNQSRRGGWRQLARTKEPSYDRSWLLDVAEKVHQHQNLLRHLVEISEELAPE